MNDSAEVLVGFSCSILNEALPPDRPIKEDIEVNTAYFRQGNLACCWIVMDFMDFDLAAIDWIKDRVAETCSILPEHVHVMTTHNHGAADVELLNIGLIAEKTAEAVKAAANTAVRGYLRFAQVSVREQLSYVRRLHVEEFGSSTTLFFGPCKANGFNTSEFLKYQLHSLTEKREMPYCGKSETASRLIPFLHQTDDILAPPANPLVSILLFERKNGVAIGCICSFAAHAICCNRPEYYSSDYPYYVRQTLQKKTGGDINIHKWSLR